jgi:predicted RNase H-like HicB family nuclease
MKHPKYAVVIEKGDTSFGAYVPDLPGCVAVATTKRELEKLIAEAIAFHIEGLIENGDPVPEPASEVEYIKPAAVA